MDIEEFDSKFTRFYLIVYMSANGWRLGIKRVIYYNNTTWIDYLANEHEYLYLGTVLTIDKGLFNGEYIPRILCQDKDSPQKTSIYMSWFGFNFLQSWYDKRNLPWHHGDFLVGGGMFRLDKVKITENEWDFYHRNASGDYDDGSFQRNRKGEFEFFALAGKTLAGHTADYYRSLDGLPEIWMKFFRDNPE